MRDNILFGCTYDAHRYEMVLDACALKSVSVLVLFCSGLFCSFSVFFRLFCLFRFQLFNLFNCFLLFGVAVLPFSTHSSSGGTFFSTANARGLPENTGQRLVSCHGHAWGQNVANFLSLLLYRCPCSRVSPPVVNGVVGRGVESSNCCFIIGPRGCSRTPEYRETQKSQESTNISQEETTIFYRGGGLFLFLAFNFCFCSSASN